MDYNRFLFLTNCSLEWFYTHKCNIHRKNDTSRLMSVVINNLHSLFSILSVLVQILRLFVANTYLESKYNCVFYMIITYKIYEAINNKRKIILTKTCLSTLTRFAISILPESCITK